MSCDSLKAKLDPNNQHPMCFSNSSAANENGKRFALQNPHQIGICKVKIDGCLISGNNVQKCDYFFSVDTNPERYFLIELKGVDLNTAVRQIESTFDRLNALIGASASQFTAVIVASAVPAAANQEFRKLKEKLYQSKRLDIVRKSFQCEIRI